MAVRKSVFLYKMQNVIALGISVKAKSLLGEIRIIDPTSELAMTSDRELIFELANPTGINLWLRIGGHNT